MAERRRTPIVFGGGLDRETGVMAMQPGGMEDLRNVHLLKGKYQVRRGFERVLEFEDASGNPQTDILGGIAMQGRRAVVYVTYDSVNYKVNVFMGDHTGAWTTFLGEWPFQTDAAVDILGEINPDPPIILLCEYNNTVMMAHTYNEISQRAQTYYVYWSDADNAYRLRALTVDWDGVQNVRFRGVTDHLDYIVGWGWGDETEDRPELVRISVPGVGPEVLDAGDGFDTLHYWIVGDEGDPVIRCLPAAESLLCFKETETYDLYGRSYLNFGQRRLDAKYGMEQPRLALNIEGSVFAWTNEGPRMFAPNGTSIGLEIPLEITLPEPYDLPDQLADKYAFAVYMPVYRSIWFCFGRRVYSLYVRQESEWKWGYQELGFEPLCGFRLPQSGWGTTVAPTGYPSNPVMSLITDTTARVTWTNNNQDGDETAEVWLRPDGGAWYLAGSDGVQTLATQDLDLGGGSIPLQAGWDYDIAVRYRRGPHYTFGYESSDPMDWPATSRTTFTTTLADDPDFVSWVWSRTSATTEQIRFTIDPPHTGADYDIEVRRAGVLVHTESGVTGQFVWDDDGFTGEAYQTYDMRIVSPYVNGSYTSGESIWGGPPGPTPLSCVAGSKSYTLDWAAGLDEPVEIYDSLPSELEADALDTYRDTVSADPPWVSGQINGSTGLQPWIAIRHIVTTFGVQDRSEHNTIQADGAL
ncbi:MAG: hypothetical protein JSW25_07830 [Thermoplasmata archaeon]|nr:MAG: hypothetical protein JSW25_07830 [Thermoplasmata archaeon]